MKFYEKRNLSLMRIKNWTLPYALVYVLVWFTKQGYFTRVFRKGLSNIPKNKPVIFAANHQNSLIDPIVIATTNRYPVFFLTKSDVFKNPLIAKILFSLNMLPIYRERDGADFKEKNVAIFNRCSEILSRNGTIIIFPEGSHNTQNKLRSLKKGIARIAAQANNETQEDIWIVPVGLNYSNTRNKSADLLVSYGKAINASEIFLSKGEVKNENDLFLPLMEKIEVGLRNEMLDYSHQDFYEVYEFLLNKVRRKRTSLITKFNWNKEKNNRLTHFFDKNTTESEKIKTQVEEINSACDEFDLRPYLFQKQSQSIGLYVLGLVLGFPFAVYGFINSFIPAIIPQKLILDNIKDRQYDSSINMVLGGFLMFFFWCVQSFVVSLFTDYYLWFWYFISCVISRWFSYEYHIFYLRFRGKISYNRFVQKFPDRAKLLQNYYSELKLFITKL